MRSLHTLIVVIAAVSSASAWSHGGGLNRQGCHKERATMGYHCHRSSYTPPPPKVRKEPVPLDPSKSNVRSFASTPPARAQGALQRPIVSRTDRNNGAKTDESTPRLSPTRRIGGFDPEVEEAQSYLEYLGFDVGPVDGLIGVRTLAAIRAYQRTRSLEPTGLVSERLLNHMAATIDRSKSISTANREITRKVNLVERAQFYLKLVGLYSGENNGVSDVELEQAIMRFQNMNRISVDGVLTAGLLEKIKSVVLQ